VRRLAATKVMVDHSPGFCACFSSQSARILKHPSIHAVNSGCPLPFLTYRKIGRARRGY
jgi:hypothetical protein